MSLVDWYPQGVEGEVRRIMARQGHPRPSQDECRAWVREFMRKCLPAWHPGKPLDAKQAQKLGAAFEVLLVQVRGPLPHAPRQKLVRRAP